MIWALWEGKKEKQQMEKGIEVVAEDGESYIYLPGVHLPFSQFSVLLTLAPYPPCSNF